MSLIISTGSNIGDRLNHLKQAKKKLCSKLELIQESNVYCSRALDYLEQPDFLNQVLEFKLPKNKAPHEILHTALSIEKTMGRVRTIDKGPRTIDIDLLFWGKETIVNSSLQIPHPRLFDRSFIVLPLMELPFFQSLKSSFTFKTAFENEASIFRK